MALPVLILGESGTGKSASLRNFDPSMIKVINVEGKPLPFKNKFESLTSDNYVKILKDMQATKKPVIVVDDAQYLMANEFMRRATERGYDKFTEIAQNFWNLIQKVKELPNDQIVYFMAHIERDQNGNEKIKTIGKLLDEKITVEGMFTIVLKTSVNDGAYTFLTQNSGHDTVKSPIGMFPSVAIDNDLKYVDEKIRNYYEIGNYKSDEEMAKADDAAKAEAPIEEKKSRRGRRSAEKESEPSTTTEEVGEEETTESTTESADLEPADEVSDGASQGAEPVEEKPRRRRGSRAVIEEAVAENVSDSEEVEVPFNEMPAPELPRRKRREEPQDDIDAAEMGLTEEVANGNAIDNGEAAPIRRRRRRG